MIVAGLILVAIIIAFLVYRDGNARQDAATYLRQRDDLQVRHDDLREERDELLQRINRTYGQLDLVRSTTTDEDSKYLLRQANDTLRGVEPEGPMARYHKGATS